MAHDSQTLINDAFLRHEAAFEESVKQIVQAVERSADILLESVKSGKKLLACGNGGSAADAEHLAAEFVCKYKDDRRPLPALTLTAHTSALTAIANDYGYEYVFSRQVEALGSKEDVLVAITTSGKSQNVLRAIEEAKKRGLKTIALTGKKGEGLAKVCDIAIVVPSEETARIQEIHKLVIHAWCEYVDHELLK